MAELRWTVEQARAIRSDEDTLLVANAGTGKTTTVVGKVMWRLGLPFGVEEATGRALEPPSDPCGLDEIAAITFTEKAAYDLRRQLRARIEQSPRAEALRWEMHRASVGTIHSFCGALLRENALRFGIDPTFEILDEDQAWAEQCDLIREILMDRLARRDPAARTLVRGMKLTGWRFAKGAVEQVHAVVRDLRWRDPRYERWLEPRRAGEDARRLDWEELADRCHLDAKDEAALRICEHLIEIASETRRRWEAWLEDENKRDFDSLVLDAAALLAGDSGRPALAAIRERFRMLVIDEFQDTDSTQRDIAFAIARGVPRPQLFLVGDPKQSIYRFRGADISVWNAVAEDFERRPGGGGARGRVLELPRNFRSAPPIVDFVNVVGEASMLMAAKDLEAERPESRIDYAELVAGLESHDNARVEWIMLDDDLPRPMQRAHGAEVTARHVRYALRNAGGTETVRDPATGEMRAPRYRDIAVLYRGRSGAGLDDLESEFRRHGIPFVVAGVSHLGKRQEILDVLNVLRLIRNPRDDMRAFGFLRSPFVGLRDETIARIRLLGRGGPLLRQARRWLETEAWPEAPDHPELAKIEEQALRRGLDALDALRELAPRVALDELIEELLERTGYRLHVLLMEGAEEVLANLQSLIHFAEAHRGGDLAAFFQVWDRATTRDVGIPQAPLYSKDDDVVTLTTIHQAKGLEWPIVFLVGVNSAITRAKSNEYWSDPELGPVFCVRKADQGERTRLIAERERLEEVAEETRLLYVALTRARDRLFIVGKAGGKTQSGYDAWLSIGNLRARRRGELQPESVPPSRPPALAWLDEYELAPVPKRIDALPEPPRRWMRSATELMLRDSDPAEWERRYRHGVQAPRDFAPRAPDVAAGTPDVAADAPSLAPGTPDSAAGTRGEGGAARLTPLQRGQVIHGALERLEAEMEIARVVQETIGSLDEPELEAMLRPGTAYREQLEEEIRRVAESPEWAWYTRGEPGRDYWKEIGFAHLLGPRDWRVGWLDLYRRLGHRHPEALRRAFGPGARADALIVDFKTHEIGADAVHRVARDYRIQARVYRAAVEAMVGRAAVGLHFTRPNELVAMTRDAP